MDVDVIFCHTGVAFRVAGLMLITSIPVYCFAGAAAEPQQTHSSRHAGIPV
jgi:hypothetical protein